MEEFNRENKQNQMLNKIDKLEKENEKLKAELKMCREAAKHLNESETKFEQLFDHISDAVYYLKIKEGGVFGEFIEVNSVAYSRLGYTREEMLQLTPFDIDIRKKEDLIKLLKAINQNKTLTFETTHICKDGSLIPVEIKTHTVEKDGEKYTLSVCRDISERKKAEEMMVQAEKLNVVSQIAAGIAHEVRNPLTSLKGFVQLFRSGTVPNELFLNVMENELERLDVISSEFLTLAKPYNKDFAPIDLKELLENVAALLDKEASKRHIEIVTIYKNPSIIVHGISTELKKVFLNLIKNAIEVTEDNGKVTVQAQLIEGKAAIMIQDNGIGMTEEQLSRLGEPFFTTKETGTGLGMMVTYKIINMHSGEISVESKLNHGTTFTVMLPAFE